MRLHRNAKTTPKLRQLLIDRVTRLGWTQRPPPRRPASVCAPWRSGRSAPARAIASWRIARRGRIGNRGRSTERGRRPFSRFGSSARRRGRSVRGSACRVRRSRWSCGGPDSIASAGSNRPPVGSAVRVAACGRPPPSRHQTAQPHSRHRPSHSWRSPAEPPRRRLRVRRMSRSTMRRGSPMPKSPLANERRACAAFLRRTLVWFRRRGVRIRRLLTDNAPGYRVAALLRASAAPGQLRHRFTRPYRPQTNGKAERFIQTLLREWAYRVPFAARRDGRPRSVPYLRFYNHRRPHASLGRRSPWMRFQEAA